MNTVNNKTFRDTAESMQPVARIYEIRLTNAESEFVDIDELFKLITEQHTLNSYNDIKLSSRVKGTMSVNKLIITCMDKHELRIILNTVERTIYENKLKALVTR